MEGKNTPFGLNPNGTAVDPGELSVQVPTEIAAKQGETQNTKKITFFRNMSDLIFPILLSAENDIIRKFELVRLYLNTKMKSVRTGSMRNF